MTQNSLNGGGDVPCRLGAGRDRSEDTRTEFQRRPAGDLDARLAFEDEQRLARRRGVYDRLRGHRARETRHAGVQSDIGAQHVHVTTDLRVELPFVGVGGGEEHAWVDLAHLVVPSFGGPRHHSEKAEDVRSRRRSEVP